MKMVKQIVTMVFAALMAQCVWAATPVAVWDGFTGESGDLTKNGYTWVKSDKTAIADGVVTIGSDGGLTLAVPNNTTMKTARKATIIMDVSDIPSGAVAVYDLVVNGCHVSLSAENDGDSTKLRQRWQFNGTDYGNLPSFDRVPKHRIAFAFEGSTGVGATTFVDGVQKMNHTGLLSSSNQLTALAVGQYNDATTKRTASGMKVYRVALFDSKLSESDVGAYAFPSEITHLSLSGDVTTAEINEAAPSAANIELTLDAGATVTITDDLAAKVKFVSSGDITFAAAAKPSAEKFANFDVSGIAGLVKRSWTVDAFGINFSSTNGNDKTGALETSTWLDNSNDASGSTVIADGLARIEWTSPNTWNDKMTGSSFIKGYLDDSSGVRITVLGIPYPKYDVIVYGTTDTAGVKLTAKTINGTSYTFDTENVMAAKAGTDVWGNSQSSATAATYGVNALRVANQTASTLTIESNASGNNRGCVSAIQIIPVGDAVCTIGTTQYDTLAKAMSAAKGGATAEAPITVTLTATTNEAVKIPENVVLSTTKTVKYTGTVSGAGTIVYDAENSNTAPTFNAADAWKGVAWFKNFGVQSDYKGTTIYNDNGSFLANVNKAGSKIKLTGVGAYYTGAELVAEIVLEDGEGARAFGWENDSGSSGGATIIDKMSGSGTYKDVHAACSQKILIKDISGFTGAFAITGKKVTLGGTTQQATATGSIVLAENTTAIIPSGKVWTTAGGIKIDGTLKFTEDASLTSGRKERFNAGTLTGSGLIDLSETTADNDHQLRILFKGTNHNFTGSIKTRNGTHFVFAAANASTTGMAFSNAGFICLEGSNAVLGPTAEWTASGLYLGANTKLTANGGTINGRVFALTSTIAIGGYAKPAMTVTGAFDCSDGNQRLTLQYPTEAPTEPTVKLFAWGSKGGSINANTFQGTVPTGYYLSAEADGLYLKSAVVGPETTVVANKYELSKIVIENGGVETFEGAGGVKISDLQLKTGGMIVIDPIKTPVYALAKPTLEGTIKLAAAYDGCKLGKFTLLTWKGGTLGLDAAALKALVSIGSEADYTVEEIDPEGISGHKQLILKIGDYDTAATPIKVMPLGDSITEGTSQYSNFARPNYRVTLMAKLEANGYKAESCGYQNSCNYNSAGVLVPVAHQWHCGMSGQECQTLSAAGWEDSIDVALDAAGYPDYVTFKIGTNDMKDGSFNADELFRSWTNVLWKINRARPNAKIICGTVLTPDTKTQLAKTTAFNQKIKDFVKNGDFPKDHIFVADLFEACPRPNPQDTETIPSGEGTNFQDWLHPNWVGHDLTSSCWRDAIIEAEKTVITRVDETVVPNTNHGAVNNVPENYRKGFVKIATITPTATWKLSQGIESIMTVEPGMESQEFAKVGYYMELQRRNIGKVDYQGHVRFVWADMEAFGTKNLAAFGISSDMINHQQIVNNLHVYSNDTGIRKVDPSVTTAKGLIEFTKFGIGNGNANVPGGPRKKLGYSWNDVLNTTGEYGCLQIHRVFDNSGEVKESWNDAEVLLAFNRWTSNSNNEIGIGSCAQKIAPINSNQTIDYIGTAGIEKLSSTAYDAMTIEIWGQLPAVTIEIPAAPTGAEVEVTVDGEIVDASSGAIEATPGAEIEVAYFAARDYNMNDVVFTFVAGEESTIDISQVVPVAKVYVAQIGTDGKKYETLQAAINATEDGDTVYLIADTIETISTQFAAANITLHINEGVTLTGKEWYTIFNYQNTLTIEGKGAIVNAVNPSYSTAFYNQEGTLYVRGGTIEALKYIFQESSPVKTEVTGGKFNLNPRPWLANKYTTTKSSDNKYFVVEALTYVAKIDTTEYETLQAAMDAVTEGQMIELACSTTEEITFDKNFIVAIKSDGYNYGTITGAKGLWERWNGQYSNVALYVVISKSMESLVEHLTANISKYPGNHGRFYIYEDWTLSKDVTIPTVNDLSQSIFPVQNTFVLDLNGYTLDQAPVKSTHGGYPTIVAGHNTKVTIKDSSKDQTGILCGIGWAVDIYDNPNTSVTLESGTITTHGAEKKDSVDYHGRVIRLNGGSFIMNGGRITLEHLVDGNKIFGVITANTAVASTPHIEINGGYVQCATKDQLVSTNDPNCLIGGSKGPDSEVEITGGSFSLLPPVTYFAEGLAAVVDENGNFHVQTVVHESEDVTIAVSDDGKKLAPAVPAEGSVKIFASAEEGEKQVYVIDIAKQETPAALYRIVTTDAEGTESTSNVGVIKVEEKSPEKKTIAVAVPFTGATVENLLNTALLSEGDTVMAYVDGSYKVWELAADKTWQARAVTREGGTEMSPEASVTPLNRGQAVWVTTAGQVVTFGAYVDTEVEIELEDGHNLLGNTKLVEATPAAAETEQIQLIGEDEGVLVSRYNKTATGWESKIQTRTQLSNGKWVVTETTGTAAPKVKPGRGFWRIKPATE